MGQVITIKKSEKQVIPHQQSNVKCRNYDEVLRYYQGLMFEKYKEYLKRTY